MDDQTTHSNGSDQVAPPNSDDHEGYPSADPTRQAMWGTRKKEPIHRTSFEYAGIDDVYRLPDFGVDGNAALLRRYEYIQRHLVFIEAAHVAARSRHELKLALSKHLYEDSEATQALRTRIGELRQPQNIIHRDPDQRLKLLMDELLHARTDAELVLGLYEVVKPALLAAYKDHMRLTHQLADQPTLRILRQIVWDLEEQLDWGQEAIARLVDDAGERAEVTEFRDKIAEFLAAAGGVTGQEEGARSSAPDRWRSIKPFSLPEQAVRDERFPSTIYYRIGAPEYAENEAEDQLYWFMRIRQEEIEVCELLGSVIFQNQNQDWEFIADVARQLWDEARHTMLGQAVLEDDGIDWMSYPQHVSIYDTHIKKIASSQHAYLWAIESQQMPRGGKRAELELARDKAGHRFATVVQDYDWADEIVHVAIGRKRVPELFDGDSELAWQAAQDALDEWWSVTEGEQRKSGVPMAVGSMRPGAQGSGGY